VSRGILSVCCELSATRIGAGTVVMLPPAATRPPMFETTRIIGYYCLPLLAAITSFLNIIFATMITIRLVIHQRQMKKLLGKAYASPYNRTISIIIESCALIAVTNPVLIMVSYSPTAYIPQGLIIHVSVSFLSSLQSGSFITSSY